MPAIDGQANLEPHCTLLARSAKSLFVKLLDLLDSLLPDLRTLFTQWDKPHHTAGQLSSRPQLATPWHGTNTQGHSTLSSVSHNPGVKCPSEMHKLTLHAL